MHRSGQRGGIVDKIHNCRHEISVWRKDNPAYGKETISTLQKALIEMRNFIGNKRVEIHGIYMVIGILSSTML